MRSSRDRPRPSSRLLVSAPLPGRSRLTVRRAVAGLRRTREALADLESQLGALLTSLAADTPRVDGTAPDELHRAAADAGAALGTSVAVLLRLRAR